LPSEIDLILEERAGLDPEHFALSTPPGARSGEAEDHD